MFLLRRTAARALAAPSKALISKPRSITTYSPIAFRQQQKNLTSSFLQRRFISDDASKPAEDGAAEGAAKTNESFSQTAEEAPVEENLSPASEGQSTLDSLKEQATGALDSVAETVGFTGRSRPTNAAATPNNTLYIGNLFYEVTEDQLHQIFSRFGPIAKTNVIYDNKGLSRGFAYVEFENKEDATSAVDNLDGQIFEGRNLRVQFHQPRNPAARNPSQTGTVNPPSKTLFIGNMSFEMSDKDLNDLFRDIRNVMDVRVAIDRRTGQPRGFAHADFVDVASAEKAKAILDNKVVYGRELRIDYSASGGRARNDGQRNRYNNDRNDRGRN